MILIPVSQQQLADGTPILEPSTPIPADAVMVLCDGTNYTVYQPGDELPQAS